MGAPISIVFVSTDPEISTPSLQIDGAFLSLHVGPFSVCVGLTLPVHNGLVPSGQTVAPSLTVVVTFYSPPFSSVVMICSFFSEIGLLPSGQVLGIPSVHFGTLLSAQGSLAVIVDPSSHLVGAALFAHVG